MNDTKRTEKILELEGEYIREAALAHDRDKEGLAHHLFAAQIQHMLADLAATEEDRQLHTKLAQTHRTLVAECKKKAFLESTQAEAAPGPATDPQDLLASIESMMSTFSSAGE